MCIFGKGTNHPDSRLPASVRYGGDVQRACSSNRMRNRLALAFLYSLVGVVPLAAQIGTSIYPSILYPGENVVTITNPAGIETIRGSATSNTSVIVPGISGCPTSVNVRVRV